MDCLNPPLEDIPTEDWFCHQCNVIPGPPPQLGQREVEIDAMVRPPVEIVRQQIEIARLVVRQLDLRTVVRLIVERNRQMIALNSTADVRRAVTVYEPRLPATESTVRKRRQTVSVSRPRKKNSVKQVFRSATRIKINLQPVWELQYFRRTLVSNIV